MKKIITIVAAAAMATNITCAQHLDLAVTLGTDGIGIDLSTPVVKNWVNVRAGFTYMPRFNATMHFGFEAGDESMTPAERDEHTEIPKLQVPGGYHSLPQQELACHGRILLGPIAHSLCRKCCI